MTAQIVPEDHGTEAPLAVPEEPDSDTSSESDTEQISDIREMREIIARMDDDDDGGDHDKWVPNCSLTVCIVKQRVLC